MEPKPGVIKTVKSQGAVDNQGKATTPANVTGDGKRWQDELRALKLADIQKRAPGFYEASGGDKMKIKRYSDKTANGLAACIVDYIRFNGGDAQRINTTGMMRKIGGQMKWTRSGSRPGAADLHCIIQGRAVSVEIKIGKDQQSEAQKKEQARIEVAGGLYFVATDMPSFLQWYRETFSNFNKNEIIDNHCNRYLK